MLVHTLTYFCCNLSVYFFLVGGGGGGVFLLMVLFQLNICRFVVKFI